MGMTAIVAALAVAIAIVVVAAIFTALDVFLALSVEKATRRECLLCETKKFESMNDITFAKAHMGEYFKWMGHEVRVIGYDPICQSNCVIVDCLDGWSVDDADCTDVINRELCETGRCEYCRWEDLK